ncbi:MFS transporter [Actinomycetospora sp. C-140]
MPTSVLTPTTVPTPTTPAAPSEPSRAAHRWLLATLTLLAAGANMPSPLYPVYQQQFGFDDLTLTAVYAVYALVTVPALLLIGPLGDRLPPRWVLRGGVLAAAAGSLCLALATSTGWLVAGRVAYGIALGAVTGVGVALAARTGRPGRGAASGALAFLLGSAVGPSATGLLARFAPWPTVLPFALHLVLLAAVLVGLRTVHQPPQEPDTTRDTPTRDRRPRMSPAARRAVLVATANGFLGWTVVGLFLGLVPTMLDRVLGVGDPAVTGAVAGGVVAVSLVTPPVLRRLGARRSQVVGLVAVVVPLAILAAGAGSLTVVLVAAVVAGLAHGLLYGGAVATVAAVAPPARASGITAAVHVACNVGVGLPTLVAGVATALVPLTTTVSVVAALALALGVAVLAPTARLERPNDVVTAPSAGDLAGPRRRSGAGRRFGGQRALWKITPSTWRSPVCTADTPWRICTRW